MAVGEGSVSEGPNLGYLRQYLWGRYINLPSRDASVNQFSKNARVVVISKMGFLQSPVILWPFSLRLHPEAHALLRRAFTHPD